MEKVNRETRIIKTGVQRLCQLSCTTVIAADKPGQC